MSAIPHPLAAMMAEHGYRPEETPSGMWAWRRYLDDHEYVSIVYDYGLGALDVIQDRDWSVMRYHGQRDAYIEIVGQGLTEALDAGEKIPQPRVGDQESFSSIARCLSTIAETAALMIDADLDA